MTETDRQSVQEKKHTHLTNLTSLQKGGVPAAPSGTATLLRLSPNHLFYPRPILAVTDFRHRPGNVFTAPWLMRDY